MTAASRSATYNLDRMQFRPGQPAEFIEAETPQGDEWWAANRGGGEAQAIIAFLAEAHAKLAEVQTNHNGRVAA